LSSDLERRRGLAWVAAMSRLNGSTSTSSAGDGFYAEVFNQMPTPIWVEDWSAVRPELEHRGLAGQKDLEQILHGDTPLLLEIYGHVVQLDMNDAALAFFSETSKRALVERLYDDPPEGSLASAAIMMAALDRGDVSHSWISQCQPYPDGAPRWIEETYYVPPAYRETWARIVYTVHDVTELKMTERNLERARLEADAANRAKSDFLANVSHELRTPLHAIAGFSELLIDEKLGPIGHDAYREYAHFIRDSGEHLLGLITDILDLSKYEAGELALREDEVELQETVDGAVRFISERAENLSIALHCDVTPAGAAVLGDERKLKQILVNLLDNAVKFTKTGGRVSLRGEPDDDGGYVITVEDTGIGIKHADIPRVLERFGQTSESREQGTGLGLPLARALAELHGGSLTLTSQPGVGTRVTVKLPASRVIHPGDRRQAETAG
jgi:signal transduction histidine kinase